MAGGTEAGLGESQQQGQVLPWRRGSETKGPHPLVYAELQPTLGPDMGHAVQNREGIFPSVRILIWRHPHNNSV